MPRPSALPLALLALAAVAPVSGGCGGGGGHHDTTVQSLRISGGTATTPGGSLTFIAYVDGGSGKVAWSADGGTITSAGVYTAPTTQGTYTVTATAGGKTASAQVTVDDGIAITLSSPATVPLMVSKSTLRFSATVTGATDTGVDWSVAGGTATIGTDGTFTAPAGSGFYVVVGKSHADPTKSVSRTVQVASSVGVRIVWTTYAGASRGATTFSLLSATAPNTVANFVSLVNRGFYDGIRIHRYEYDATAMKGVVQFGSPLSRGATLAQLQDFYGSGINNYTSSTSVPFEDSGQSNVRYTLAAASTSEAGPAGDQVFLNLGDNSSGPHGYDHKYDAFGVATADSQATFDALRAGDTIASATVVLP